MRPQGLAMAKTVAKAGVVSDTAGGKKSVARRSTGLDHSSHSNLLRSRSELFHLPLNNQWRQASSAQPAKISCHERGRIGRRRKVPNVTTAGHDPRRPPLSRQSERSPAGQWRGSPSTDSAWSPGAPWPPHPARRAAREAASVRDDSAASQRLQRYIPNAGAPPIVEVDLGVPQGSKAGMTRPPSP